MARNHFTRLALATVTIAGLLLQAQAREGKKTVRIEFEMDGVPAQGPDSIEFYDSAGKLAASRSIREGFFEVPDQIPAPFEVRLRFQGRSLAFAGTYPNVFESAWRVGIDRPPFDPSRPISTPGKRRPKELWYIEFSPSNGDGTSVVVEVW